MCPSPKSASNTKSTYMHFFWNLNATIFLDARCFKIFIGFLNGIYLYMVINYRKIESSIKYKAIFFTLYFLCTIIPS